MSLPWLADILSGLVYYFAGMLAAQRKALVRQPGFGSGRSLLLLLPGLDAARILASARSDRDHRVVCGNGGVGQLLGRRRVCHPAAARQGWPGDDFSGALLILSMLGKQMIGEWVDSGLDWQYGIHRQGRVMVAPKGPSVRWALGPT